MWETGTIVSVAIAENGAGSTCSGPTSALTVKPGEHVPRMPSGSQVPEGSKVVASARCRTATCSPGAASGWARSVVSRSSA